jgi:hypothetical protein
VWDSLFTEGVEMLVPCQVSKGLRDKEVIVEVEDYHGKKQSMPLEREFIVYKDKKTYLPVRAIFLHEKDQAALVVLPVESDSGAHRIWVKLAGSLSTEEAPA